MGKRICVFSMGGPETLGNVESRLKEAGYTLYVCDEPTKVLDTVARENIHLMIAAGNSADLGGTRLAQKVYDLSAVPTFLVLDSAGDTTQTELWRHPGIIGIYFQPLNEEKLLERVRKFFETLNIR